MALRELLAKFDVKVNGAGALKKVDAQMSTAKKGAGGLLSSLVSLKGAFAALAAGGIAVAARAMIGWITSLTQAVDPIGKLSTALDISTDSIQAWNIVASEAGAGQAEVATAFRTLAKASNEAKEGIATYADNFKALNINIEEYSKLSLEDQFLTVTAAVGGLENQTQKLAIGQELLGRGFLKLLPGLKGTKEEMQAALEQAKELSGIFSEDFIRASEATNDEIGRMKMQWQVFKSTIVMAILPALRTVVEWLRSGFAAVRKFTEETNVLSRAFKVTGISAFAGLIALIVKHFGTAWRVASRFIGVIFRFARVLAPWLAWALILDDIIVFLQGGDSALGRLLDSLFGAGTSGSVLEHIKAGAARAWEGLKEVIKWLKNLWSELENSGAVEVLGAMFQDFANLAISALKGLMSTIAAVGLLIGLIFGNHGPEAATKLEATFLRVTQSIGEFFDGMFGGISSAADAAWAHVKSGAEALVNALAWPIQQLGKLFGAAEDFAKVDFSGVPKAPPAQAPGRAGGGPREVRGGDANVTVNLEGKPTKEVVKYTTDQARAAAADLLGKSNRQIANGLVRGAF